MPKRIGPAARNAVNPAALLAFLDAWTEYATGGYPRRTRLEINGTPVTDNDARVIRRWRAGGITGITVPSAFRLLTRYDLTLSMLTTFCEQTNVSPTLHGALPKENV